MYSEAVLLMELANAKQFLIFYSRCNLYTPDVSRLSGLSVLVVIRHTDGYRSSRWAAIRCFSLLEVAKGFLSPLKGA